MLLLLLDPNLSQPPELRHAHRPRTQRVLHVGHGTQRLGPRRPDLSAPPPGSLLPSDGRQLGEG